MSNKILHNIDATWSTFWDLQERHQSAHLSGLLSHLARWEEAAADVITERVAGELTDAELARYNDEDGLNAFWARADEGATLEAARERCRAAHSRLRGLLEGLDEEAWKDPLVRHWAEVSCTRHYESHTGDLARIADSGRGAG